MKDLLNIKNIIAFIAFAGIWGYVGKKYFSSLESEPPGENIAIKQSFFTAKNYSKDTFELKLSLRDPFLNGKTSFFNPNTVTQNQTNHTDKPKQNPQPLPFVKPLPVSWPNISYFGYVKNKVKGKQACLVKINQQNHKMFVGDKISEVFLVNAFKDSIIVKYNENFKTVKK